jgi:sugar phosphate isomerase/epimerase
MTLPYAEYSFERALEGIAATGYKFVSFGLWHEGNDVPDEANPNAVAELKTLFARYDLTPSQIIANKQFAPGEPIERAIQRIQLAQELGVREILTVGESRHGEMSDEEFAPKHRAFVEQYQRIAQAAENYDVTITIKPHTGNTATAKDVMQTLREIGAPNVLGCYDPGNVQFYEGVGAARDFPQMAQKCFSIIAKDHRGAQNNLDFPVPGTGDVDFAQIFSDWKKAGAFVENGNVVIERVDGPTDDAKKVDERMRAARESITALMRQSGLSVE